LKFFGTTTPPLFPYALNQMDELAKNVIEPLDLHSELFNKKNNDVNFLFASFSFVNKFNFVNNLRKERGELYSELS